MDNIKIKHNINIDKTNHYLKYGCVIAAQNGDLENLIKAHKLGCLFNSDVCAMAAKNGHINCLKYAHKNGCPWNEDTCAFSAFNGHLNCLKYAKDNGCEYLYD